jgi:hypothetical protein
MKSLYVTFILRMRLETQQVNEADAVHGSFQQVGQVQIHHFDSLEKFWALFQESLAQATPPPQSETP